MTSQYRCDNGCKYNDNHYCESQNCRLSFSDISTIEIFGCASHSDFHIPIVKYPGCDGICAFEPFEREAIKKAEREKVLDELVSLDMFIARHVGGKYVEIGEVRQFIHNRMKELRKGGE